MNFPIMPLPYHYPEYCHRYLVITGYQFRAMMDVYERAGADDYPGAGFID